MIGEGPFCSGGMPFDCLSCLDAVGGFVKRRCMNSYCAAARDQTAKAVATTPLFLPLWMSRISAQLSITLLHLDDNQHVFLLCWIQLIGWLTVRLIEWKIDQLIGWLVDRLFDWLIDLLIDRLIELLVDWLIDLFLGLEDFCVLTKSFRFHSRKNAENRVQNWS